MLERKSDTLNGVSNKAHNGTSHQSLQPFAARNHEIVIVSSQGLLRHSLQRLAESCCRNVSAYSTFEQLRPAVNAVEPGSILLLEPVAGVGIAEQADKVARHSPSWNLVLVVRDIDDADMGDCIRAGVQGCITQETPPEMICSVLEVVSAGHIVWPRTPNVVSTFDRRANDRSSHVHHRRPTDFHQKLALLSKREKEVLGFVGHGLGNKRVATAMGISDTTVRLHMRSIMRKLGTENRTQVAILALHAQSEQN